MSESNSVRVSLVQRTSFDTAAALNMLVLPTTGQSLRNQVGYAQSQTLRTDANIQDLVRLSLGTSGGLPIEFQFPVVNEALWFALRAVLRATETAQFEVTNTAVTATQSTVTGVTGAVGNIEPGDIARVVNTGGVGNPQDNFYKVLAVSSTDGGTVTLQGVVWANNSSTVTITRGARMKNGTERYYFDVEVGRLDVNLFELFRKLAFNGMALTIADNAITTAAFDLIGIDSVRAGSSQCLGHPSPTPGAILDAFGVPVFNVAGVAFSAKSIGFNISNNARSRTQIGTLGGTAIPFGAFTVTTRIQSYVANFTEINNYTGNVPTDLWFVTRNSSNQAVSFSFPRYKWSDLAADTQGLNQDDYLNGSGQAYLHPTELCTMRVQRWAA